MSDLSNQNMLSERFSNALKQGLLTGGIAFILFLFIIGFNADYDLENQLVLTPQIGYLVNYIAIAAIGRFTWVLFGGGSRGTYAAIIPVLALFIGYRAWLWYVTASQEGIYDFSAQIDQLAIIAIILAVLLIFLNIIRSSSRFGQKSTDQVLRFISKGLSKAGGKSVSVLLIIYPILVIFLVYIFAYLSSTSEPKLADIFKKSSFFIDNYGIYILIYVILAWGLNIVVGLAGLLDLGYVAFYAVGAYTVTLLGNHFGFSFWLCLPLAGILAALWGMMLGFPVLRLRGDYLAIVTLAFGEIIRIVLQNWEPVTGGSNSVKVQSQATFFGISFARGKESFADIFGLINSQIYFKIFLYYLVLFFVIAMAIFITRLKKLPIGRAWEALREDEIACRSLGINLVTTKLSAFATGAFFGGIAGAFFAQRQGMIDYTSFNFLESIIILAIVVLGGMGSLKGIAIAAIIMVGGAEALRSIPSVQMVFGPGFDPTQYRMLWFGLAMVFIMIWRPRGFVSGREPSAYLKEKKNISGNFTKEGNG
ncbi:branched-chain amino acid ABC transporter permease [Bartonella sp. HY038]|uniref:ABC transporter permease subunit n=1 Tax=Bartonella sp. HY038 TaxID=2759660 RepID=UPI00352E3899